MDKERTPYRVIINLFRSGRQDLETEYEKMSKDNSKVEKIGMMTYGVYLSHKEYTAQMLQPDTKWNCPITGIVGEWDDNNYEEFID